MKRLLMELFLARITRGIISPKLGREKVDIINADFIELVNGFTLEPGYRFATTEELEKFNQKYHPQFPVFTFGKSGVRELRTGFNPLFLQGRPDDEAFYTIGQDGKAFQKILGNLEEYGMRLSLLVVRVEETSSH